jgi:hypothetical protein
MTSPRPLLIALIALLVAAAAAGCGGSDKASSAKAPLGSPSNPVPARTVAESGAAGEKAAPLKPGYAKLLKRQTAKPRSRFTPCNLVSRRQAGAILRTAIAEPIEAPLGPTCIYRAQRGRAYVTVQVKSASFRALAGTLSRPAAIRVASHRAVCGAGSASTLLVALPRHRVLSIGGPCVTAMKFASTAVRRLES